MEIVNLKPYLPKDFDLNSIVYSDVQLDSPTKKSIFIYDQVPGKKIYIQSPELQNMIELNKKSKYYELNLPLYGKKSSHVSSFINFIKELDNKVISDAKVNKNSWFDQSNKNVKYRSLVKNIHQDYIDTVEFKEGMFENGIIKLKITDGVQITANENKIQPEEIKLNYGIRTIFQLYAIWISNDLFGIYLKPIRIDQKYKIFEQIDFIASESESSVHRDTVYNTDTAAENLSDSNLDTDTSNSNISTSNYMNNKNIIDINDEEEIQNNISNIFSERQRSNSIKNLSESSDLIGSDF
jgi:hypothetical protein